MEVKKSNVKAWIDGKIDDPRRHAENPVVLRRSRPWRRIAGSWLKNKAEIFKGDAADELGTAVAAIGKAWETEATT